MEDTKPGIIGRGPELIAVDAFLATARKEFTRLTIEGEPGMGKTTLWREALGRAGAQGARVLLTRPSQAEAALSFAALADLFDAVSEATLNQLPIPQREAMSAALLRTSPPGRGIEERALCASVLSLLRLMSADGPMLVAVDDAQWLDPPSARVLAFAARRLRAEAVGFLVTVRTGGGRSPTGDYSPEPGHGRTIRLGPLTVAALHELIKERTGRSLPRPTLVRVARICGGNPLHALEVAAELAVQPVEAGRLPVPASLTDLIAARMRRLPVYSRRALLVAAALSQPTADLVDAAALEPARRAGIVVVEHGRVRFVHPLFASAIYAQAGVAERQQLHRRLAGMVADPEERARQAALGSAQPDEATAAELDAAAVLAGSRGASDAAAELQELAAALSPMTGDPAARAARLVTAGRFWFDAGDFSRSQATLERTLAEQPVGPPLTRALQLLGQLHARRSSFTEATLLASQALESAGDSADLRAGIELDLAYYGVSLGDFPGAERHARAAVAAAEEMPGPGAVADAMAVLAMAEFLLGRGLDERRIQQARELEDPTMVRAWQSRPTLVHGLLLLWTGRLTEALSTLGDLHAQVSERGEESAMPFLCLYLTWTCLWRGDLDAAAAFADEGRQAATLLDDPAAQGTALSASAMVHAFAGSSALAVEEALEAARCFHGLDWPSGTIWPLWALGLAELSNGNPGAVDAALGPLADMLPAMGAGDPVLGIFLPDEVEALIELGRLDRAEPLISWLEQRGGELDRPWALAVAGRCRGLLCAARGDTAGALAALALSLAEHERVDIPFERARTLLALGRVQRRSGSRARAGASLRTALTLFEELGTRAWAERTRVELDRLGRRAGSASALTPTEARVAELAALGLTNREVARRAFLTTKAVEANLTRVYRKLGIRSRGGLVQALATSAERTDA